MRTNGFAFDDDSNCKADADSGSDNAAELYQAMDQSDDQNRYGIIGQFDRIKIPGEPRMKKISGNSKNQIIFSSVAAMMTTPTRTTLPVLLATNDLRCRKRSKGTSSFIRRYYSQTGGMKNYIGNFSTF